MKDTIEIANIVEESEYFMKEMDKRKVKGEVSAVGTPTSEVAVMANAGWTHSKPGKGPSNSKS